MAPEIAKKIEGFFSTYPARSYRAGQILIHAHDNPAHVFRIVEGRIKQYDISYRGDEIVLNTFKSPAFFPMSYAINHTPNVYFYEAESDVTLQPAPIGEAVEFIKANPDIVFDLLSRVYKGTDGLLGRLAHLMGGSARSRVLHELLIESRRFGRPTGRGVSISLTESDLGAHAGLARETVSREIHKLKADGLITIEKSQIIITNLDQLATLVSHEL
jgi:CRP-like cAMP-binding protein